MVGTYYYTWGGEMYKHRALTGTCWCVDQISLLVRSRITAQTSNAFMRERVFTYARCRI